MEQGKKMVRNMLLILGAVLSFYGCAGVTPYHLDDEDNYVYMDIIKKDDALHLLSSDKVTITLRRCYTDDIGKIDISDETQKTVKISTLRPFYAGVLVANHYSNGAMNIAFKPLQGKRYRLVYIREPNNFKMELYSYENKSAALKREKLYIGPDYIPYCSHQK